MISDTEITAFLRPRDRSEREHEGVSGRKLMTDIVHSMFSSFAGDGGAAESVGWSFTSSGQNATNFTIQWHGWRVDSPGEIAGEGRPRIIW